MRFKFPTAGQHLDDVPTVSFVLQGNSLKPAPVTDLLAVRDSSLDWYIPATGHPTIAQIPETYTCRLRDGDGTLLRDMQIAPWTAMAAMFEFYHGDITYLDEDAIITNNNVEFTYAAHPPTMIKSIQPIALGASVNASVRFGTGLQTVTFQDGEFPDWQLSFNTGTHSAAQTNLHWAYWTGGVLGEGASAEGDITIPTTGGVVNVRIVFVGSEVRVQLSGAPINPTQPPNVIFKTQGIAERHLYFWSQGDPSVDGPFVDNVTIGGTGKPQAIYALQQQEDDLLAIGVAADTAALGVGVGDLDVEMWQNSPIAGIQGRSVRKVF